MQIKHNRCNKKMSKKQRRKTNKMQLKKLQNLLTVFIVCLRILN